MMFFFRFHFLNPWWGSKGDMSEVTMIVVGAAVVFEMNVVFHVLE